jgi:two-component system chemotaxis sensor kinase CheA
VVRVEVGRLDYALDVLSTLMVTRSRLQLSVQGLARGEGSLRELNNLLLENGRQLRDLREAIMRARMVPVTDLLERTPLLVRGLSRSSGKQVQLHLDAGRNELDKLVADRLAPAIVHLLRNAVDHGIEAPAQRTVVGKAPEGRIEISCLATSGTQLTLSIADDGRGIDPEKVARRAGRPTPLDDVALLALITRPGLSTLETATHTSGRGLGMDIVKRIVVDELGGQLALHNRPGAGTRFTLTVPLSMTILDAFSFVSASRTFVVPVSAVEDLVELEPADVSATPNPGGGGGAVRLLKHRGLSVPLYTLSALLGLGSRPISRAKAIIVRQRERRFAFEVDAMLGQHEIVVRPLRDALVRVRGVSGSTDLGDGQPTLVLDLLALIEPAPEVTA